MSACIDAFLGDGPQAARQVGAAETIRQKAGMPISPSDALLLEQFLSRIRSAIPPEQWDADLAAGRALTQEEAVTLLLPTASPL